jgi:hypothetical protein
MLCGNLIRHFGDVSQGVSLWMSVPYADIEHFVFKGGCLERHSAIVLILCQPCMMSLWDVLHRDYAMISTNSQESTFE